MVSFREVSRGQIGPNRFLVISQRSDGKLSLAQQLEAKVDTNVIHFFMKNAIITDMDGLMIIKTAVDKAVHALEPYMEQSEK
jgi:hypothetical protein